MIHLPNNAQEILEASMVWMDRLYDEAAGLLYMPDDPEYTPSMNPEMRHHMVRESAYYALGLLMRDNAGDRQRAEQVLYNVFDMQLIEPDAVYHGTFMRAPEEPHPGPEAVEWRDYDPNWRDFIGCGSALILLHFENILTVDLCTRIEAALRHAVEGTLARKVSPSYTNIALMDAYLLHYAGRRLGVTEWQAEGEALAEKVFELFSQNNAFEEYNSPTYYGVDLFALALWRSFSQSDRLRDWGVKMEAGMWEDIAQFYHAGLRNMAGPYNRSYGMDMQRYASLLGLWVWAYTGRQLAPFPDTTQPFGHAADLGFAPVIALCGVMIPESAQPHLLSFQGARQVEHTITSNPKRVAAAWLGERVMIGGEYTSRTKTGNYQYHPLTIHWLAGDGSVGWLKLRHGAPVDVTIGEREATVAGSGMLMIQIYSAGTTAADLTSHHWRLNNLAIDVDSNISEPEIQANDESLCEVIYQGDEIKLKLRLHD